MWFQGLQKCQIIICLLIGIYLSKVNTEASVLNDGTNSDEVVIHRKGIPNLSTFNGKKKFQCPSLFGTFSDIEDCSKFYLCVAGIPQRLPCPRAKLFDKYRRKCLSFIVAICDKGKGGKETTHPDEKITTEKDHSFLCPRMFGSFDHSTECSNYYACSFFIPVLKTCPKRELFDGVKKECRPESEVNCGSRNRPTSETTPFTKPLSSEPTTPEPTSRKPTTPELSTTEPSTLEPSTLEPSTPEPTTPEITTPLLTTTEEQTPPDHNCDEDDLDCIITETGEIPSWFKCPVELGSHRHPSSKKLFIFCINWKPSVKKCGQDLIYSQEVETCVPP
ncbi:uncharacterized protein [Parasteatoda tepidariorum]|uniref:uncharacterized protein n=1 Tax=Parasteatoda tepidariorum TaxID=114398 RepID=UPI0039BC519E